MISKHIDHQNHGVGAGDVKNTGAQAPSLEIHISDSGTGTGNMYFRSSPGDLFSGFGTFFLEAYPGDLKLACRESRPCCNKKKKNQFEILFLIGKHFEDRGYAFPPPFLVSSWYACYTFLARKLAGIKKKKKILCFHKWCLEHGPYLIVVFC